MSQPTRDELLHIARGALNAGNLAFADILARMILDQSSADPDAPAIIRAITDRLRLHEPEPNSGPDRFILIKAWGFGFWSDVDAVVGGLLLAEMTGRSPVVHWGGNSLFSDDPSASAFDHFFEPVSEHSIDDLRRDQFTYFPKKWTSGNLPLGELNKWQGVDSRVGGIYLLNRPDNVVVADYHLPVVGLAPWIRTGHPLHAMSIERIYRELYARYLKPKEEILRRIDEFHQRRLADRKFIAVHVRGSDKRSELPDLDAINQSYFSHIDAMAPDSSWRIFLLTDALPLINLFRARYGDRVVLTDCERTADLTGLHYKPSASKSRRGVEVMLDTYVAARADRFIGNGASNVSCVVQHLKDWRDDDFRLLVPNIHHVRDAFLHAG